MPMYLFRLGPGQEALYRVVPIGSGGDERGYRLFARRPSGARDAELELLACEFEQQLLQRYLG